MRPTHWLPPVLWMAVIMWLSSDAGSAERTASWLQPILRALAPWATPDQLEAMHGFVRKGAHLTEYAILAALWFRAFARGRDLGARAAEWLAFSISLAWALLDEAHQATLLTRTASAADVVIDSAGALIALLLARLGWRAVADRATALLLWMAAGGGGGALVVNAFAGVPSGALWLTVLAAALLLLARHRLRRKRVRNGAAIRP